MRQAPAEPLTAVAPPAALLVALVLSLIGYAALAADVVHGGAFSELDAEVAEWVVGSMPTWVEWLARPFTWLGGVVGMTIVVTAVTVVLLRRGLRREAVVLVVVTLGSQVLVLSAKAGYERERPDVGSAIGFPRPSPFRAGMRRRASRCSGSSASTRRPLRPREDDGSQPCARGSR